MRNPSTSTLRLWIVAAGVAAAVVGALVAVVLTLASGPDANWSAPFSIIIYMLASIAVSSIVGFIFGVPRTRAAQPPADGASPPRADGRQSRFEANSNLEQISDWLTKILVGAGLVQLAALPGFLRSLGDYLGGDLGTGGPQIAVAFVIYGFGIGFLISYLWARLPLRVMVESVERDAEVESRREVLARLLTAAAVGSPQREDLHNIERVAAEAERISRAVKEFQPLLWVSGRPQANTELFEALRSLRIRIDLATSMSEAEAKLSQTPPFGLVIADLGHAEGDRDLLSGGAQADNLALTAMVTAMPDHPPVIVFSQEAGLMQVELVQAGATYVVASTTELFERIVQLLARY